MAEGSVRAVTLTGHWRDVQLQYADGVIIKARLDINTISRLEEGDIELMERIRRNMLSVNEKENSHTKEISSADEHSQANYNVLMERSRRNMLSVNEKENSHTKEISSADEHSQANYNVLMERSRRNMLSVNEKENSHTKEISSADEHSQANYNVLMERSRRNMLSVNEKENSHTKEISSADEHSQANYNVLMERSRRNMLSVNEKENSHTKEISSADEHSQAICEKKSWTVEETKQLFHLRRNMEEEFQSLKVHKGLWIKIKESLQKEGIAVTAKQCENKFKALKRDFKGTVDHNLQSGNSPKSCHFFNEFNEMYGLKAGTCPDFTLSSMEEDSSSHENGNANKKTTKRKRNKEDEMFCWYRDYERRQVSMQESKMKQRKEMHEEKMLMFERLIAATERNK